MFQRVFNDYVLSGHAYLHVPTTEKIRFLTQLKELAAGNGRQVLTWSHAAGWRDAAGGRPEVSNSGQPDAQLVPQQILEMPEDSLFFLHDFGWYVQHRTYSYADVVIAWLCEIRDTLAATGRSVIFVGPEFNVPASLANDVTTVDFPLPDDAAIAASVRFIGEGHDLDEASLPPIVAACRGMMQQQVEDRVFAAANARFVPWTCVETVIEQLEACRTEFDQAASRFLAEYPQLRSQWQAQHAGIPDGVYPSEVQLAQKFGLTWHSFKVTGAPELASVEDVGLELERRRAREEQLNLMRAPTAHTGPGFPSTTGGTGSTRRCRTGSGRPTPAARSSVSSGPAAGR